MAQISRPFQIGLVAVVLLAGVWLFALQGHSKSSEPTPPAPARPVAQAKTGGTADPGKASTSSSTDHSSVPGLTGLTKDVDKARGAVATSEQNARQLEAKSAQASNASSAPAAAQSTSPTPTSSSSSSNATSASAPATTSSRAPLKSSHGGTLGMPVGQRAVEAELRAGDTVLILFWSPNGADDKATYSAVRAMEHGHGKIAVHLQSGKEVASFGSVTRGVQVFQTPTLLVVGRKHQAIVITGLTDTFVIEQALSEARAQ